MLELIQQLTYDVTERRVIKLSIPLRVWYDRCQLKAANCNNWICSDFSHSIVGQNTELDWDESWLPNNRKVGKQICKSRGFISIRQKQSQKVTIMIWKWVILKAEFLNIQIHDVGDSTVLQRGEKSCVFSHPHSHSLFVGYFQEMRRAFYIPNRNKISDFLAFLKIISVYKSPVFPVP